MRRTTIILAVALAVIAGGALKGRPDIATIGVSLIALVPVLEADERRREKVAE